MEGDAIRIVIDRNRIEGSVDLVGEGERRFTPEAGVAILARRATRKDLSPNVALPEDTLVILRSTVYPGVTRLIYERVRARKGHFHLAFCPERIAEGRALEELRKLPQIISAAGGVRSRAPLMYSATFSPSVNGCARNPRSRPRLLR